MKIIQTVIVAAMTILAVCRVDAATFQLASKLDNSFGTPPANFSTTVEAPFVGSLTLSYDAASALTNGSYAWSSLSNLHLSVLFPTAVGGNAVTFDQSNLDFNPAGIYIQAVDGDFFFTNSATSGSSLSGGIFGGSANFINGNYLFTTQPLNNVTRMGFGGYEVKYNALYQLVNIAPGFHGPSIYMGNYGNPTDNLAAAVPEPSTLLLLTFGLGGVIAMRRLRRK